MCAGASYWAQLGKIIFGAEDEKRGYTRVRHKLLHPKTVVQGGLLKEECSRLLKDFFGKKRT
jgi:tRNA(adenine34) deaminase